MSKEAMKLSLEFVQDVHLGEWRGPVERQEEVIKALEEALANHCEDNLDMVKQEQGEPDEFLLRGILASELKCWHRLTDDEAQNLIDFVKSMGAKQEQGEPVVWIKTLDRLPAHGQRVLALVKKAEEPHTVTFFTDKWITSAGYSVKDRIDTYDLWQPVPKRMNHHE